MLEMTSEIFSNYNQIIIKFEKKIYAVSLSSMRIVALFYKKQVRGRARNSALLEQIHRNIGKQLADPLDVLRVFQITILALGIVVVYYASRGYTKTKSKPLLYLAFGFVFVSVGAALAGLLFEFLRYNLVTSETVQAASEVVGFALIVYSIVGSKN